MRLDCLRDFSAYPHPNALRRRCPAAALFLLCLLLSCASLVQNDLTERPREKCPYVVRKDIEIWDDSTRFPFNKVSMVDDIEYVDGFSSRELEDKAVTHAQEIKANGIYIYKRRSRNQDKELDVGAKRADLEVNGFHLEDHGVGPDTLHYSKTVNANRVFFEIKVKFFVYNK
jgi:hypothetical protein